MQNKIFKKLPPPPLENPAYTHDYYCYLGFLQLQVIEESNSEVFDEVVPFATLFLMRDDALRIRYIFLNLFNIKCNGNNQFKPMYVLFLQKPSCKCKVDAFTVSVIEL